MGDVRVAAADAVARVWDELEVPFIVMHGLEAYPERLGRDLDILMDSKTAGPALEQAAIVLGGLGWRIACPPPLWGRRLVALKGDVGDTVHYIELHTMTSLRWATLNLVDENEVANGSIGPFPVSSWATFAKTILSPLLGSDLARFDADYLSRLGASGVRKEMIEARASEFFGNSLSQRLASAIEDLDPGEVKGLSRSLRTAAARHTLQHPIRSARILPKFVTQKVGRLGSSSGIRVTLAVPYGEDARPVVNGVLDQVRRVFVTDEVNRRRPLLQRLEQQYRILSRQGLVLELEDSTSDEMWTVTLIGESRTGLGATPEAAVSFSPDTEQELVGQIATWLIERWLTRYACPSFDREEGRAVPLHTLNERDESGPSRRVAGR